MKFKELFNEKEKYIKLLIISGIIVILDQITKAIILNVLPLYESVTVIPGFFSITHIHNTGGAFGVFAGGSPMVRKILFLCISSLAACMVLYFYFQTPKTHPVLGAGFALIFAGAIGNLIDRVRFGKVVDFLDFFIGKMHWPAFNVADSAITIGIAIFAYHILYNKMPK